MRYLRLFLVQLRISVALSMQYRWAFVVDGLVTLVWTAIGVVPLSIAFQGRPPVNGWTFEGALVVVGWFTLLKGVLDGAVNPSLVAVVSRIRDGTLDFTLLLPADAQFLVSTAKLELWKIIDVAAGVGLLIWAFVRLGRAPPIEGVALSIALLAAATLVLYSIWILVIAAAFWVVRLDNLTYLFNSIIDFARWPVTIFKGALRFIFTFVIPLALMTTFPAQALLGTLPARAGALSIVGAVVFALAARLCWTRAIAHYTSASS